MVGRLAPPQIVVVHAGQIVMDETHGVDHLKCHGGGHALLLGAAEHFRGGQTQHRADPLPAGHEAVEHGFADFFGLRTDGHDGGLEGRLDRCLLGHEVGVEIERGGRFLQGGGHHVASNGRLFVRRCHKGGGWRDDQQGRERSGC